jgi:4-diphosphocytidyl-2-C-methyl-D-erythritol kinase
VEPCWNVRIDKRIPVAAGLGGGSSDAATALVAANATLPEPLPHERLLAVAAGIGSDVPFFCSPGPKLVEGAGERLTAVDLRQDYTVVVAVPHGETKISTADVYSRFTRTAGFAERRAELVRALAANDLAALPPNDLVGFPSPVASELLDAGAFRADVSGAGPAVYGLFENSGRARIAAISLEPQAEVWVAQPVW